MRESQTERHSKFASAVLIALSILMGHLVAEAAPTTVTRPKARTEVPAKAWSLPITLESSTTLHKADAYEREAMTSLSLSPSYLFSRNLRLAVGTMIYKEDTGVENSGWDNTFVGLSYSKALSSTKTWSTTVGTILPTNQTLSDYSSYQGAARLGTSFTFGQLILDSSLRYVFNYTRNFHEFTQTAGEDFNIRDTFVQTLEYTLPFNDQWSLQTIFSYTYGLTYHDGMRTKFYTGADINWAARKDLYISAGTSNQGNALKPNGSDSNIQFYDDNASIVKLGITYIL